MIDIQIAKMEFHRALRGSKAMQKTMTIVTTGGTIEKIYDEAKGTLSNRGPLFDKALRNLLRLPKTQLEFVSLMSKDSLDLTDDDREVIADKVEELASEGFPIIVLHGTDTMVKTMAYCAKRIGGVAVPVIFTGSMRPYGIQGSDAVQNITESLFAAKHLGPGFFLVFHSQVFSGDNIVKNYQNLTFEYESS